MGARETSTLSRSGHVQSGICENANDSKYGCGQSAFVMSEIGLTVDRSREKSCLVRVTCLRLWLCLWHSLWFGFVWFVFVRLCFFCRHKGWGLACTSAHVLVRIPVDGPSCQPTDTKKTTLNEVRALTPPLAVWPPHVCHRQENGQSPLARTWSFILAPPHLGAVLPSVRTVHH